MADQEGHGGYRMTTLTTVEIEPPYLLFIGDMDYELDAKTAFASPIGGRNSVWRNTGSEPKWIWVCPI